MGAGGIKKSRRGQEGGEDPRGQNAKGKEGMEGQLAGEIG